MTRQLDVKNVFYLKENVLIERPPGFTSLKFPSHLCHLKRALYDLKQAPRACFEQLSTFFINLGFLCSKAYSSPFFLDSQLDIVNANIC